MSRSNEARQIGGRRLAFAVLQEPAHKSARLAAQRVCLVKALVRGQRAGFFQPVSTVGPAELQEAVHVRFAHFAGQLLHHGFVVAAGLEGLHEQIRRRGIPWNCGKVL